MMEREAAAAPLDTQGGDNRLLRGRMCWILSNDAQVIDRVARLLEERKCEVLRSDALPPASAGAPEVEPALVLLDTGGDVDRGAATLQEIKRRRIKAPVVVLTQKLCREFGEKILTQGIRYYFPQEFCEEEFIEVVSSLLKQGIFE